MNNAPIIRPSRPMIFPGHPRIHHFRNGGRSYTHVDGQKEPGLTAFESTVPAVALCTVVLAFVYCLIARASGWWPFRL